MPAGMLANSKGTIQMNEDQAYVDGQDAYRAGKGVASNPHSAWNANLYDAWNMGWLDARTESYRRGGSLLQSA